MNIGSQTVYLSSGYTQSLSAYAPFSLTINPSGIPVSNKVYKVSYDFGDGSTHDQFLDVIKGSPLQFPQTHQYILTSGFVEDIIINVNIYTFNTISDINYKIYLKLNAPRLEFTESIVNYPENDLLAYWSMDQISGDFLDSSLNGFNLVKNGSIQSGEGKVSNAAFLNGDNSYLTNSSIVVPGGGDFTIVGWFKPTSRGFSEIINQWEGGYDGNFVITYDEFNNESLGFHILTTVGEGVLYAPILLNEWNFFVMRWLDGVSLDVKVNNQSWNSVTISASLLGKGGTNFLVGAGENYGYYTIIGGIDEIGIWTRALSDSEINQIYTSAEQNVTLKELHLVGSRMFGPNDDILYFFESIEPNYILPVLVNWEDKPKPSPDVIVPVDYRPFKLLAPFENEAVTSIDNGSHVYSNGYPLNDTCEPTYGSNSFNDRGGDNMASGDYTFLYK